MGKGKGDVDALLFEAFENAFMQDMLLLVADFPRGTPQGKIKGGRTEPGNEPHVWRTARKHPGTSAAALVASSSRTVSTRPGSAA